MRNHRTASLILKGSLMITLISMASLASGRAALVAQLSPNNDESLTAAPSSAQDDARTATDRPAAEAPEYAKYLPDGALGLLVIHPKQFLQHEIVKRIRAQRPEAIEAMLAEFSQEFAHPFEECEVIVCSLPSLRFKLIVTDDAIDREEFIKRTEPFLADLEWKEFQTEGGSFWQPDLGDDVAFVDESFMPGVAFPADNICVKAHGDVIKESVAGKGSHWSARVAGVPADAVLVAWLEQAALAELNDRYGDHIPPYFARVLNLADSIELVELVYPRVDSDTLATVSVTTQNAQTGDKAAEAMTMAVDLAKAFVLTSAFQMDAADPRQSLVAIGMELLESIEIQAASGVAQASLPKPDRFGESVVQPLLDSLAAAERRNARRIRAAKLHEVGIAVLYHSDTHGVLPRGEAFARDRLGATQGRPGLSWRVQLLPYLGEQALYERFHLDEPWDSEHNKTLLPLMPDVFALNNDLPAGMTNLIAPFGESTVLGPTTKRLTFPTIKDGSSYTIMCVEGHPDHAVPWTRPEDFAYDPNADNPTARFGQPDADVFLACLADASVFPVPKSVSGEVLGWLFDIDDGHAVNLHELSSGR